MQNVADMLAVLRYDPKWVEYRFIDQEYLLDQLLRYESGSDENAEHHRYASFCRLLDRSVIDDVTLERFIELAVLDEDQAMAQSALAELGKHTGLTAQQLNYLKDHPAFASQLLQNVIEQTQLLRELGSSDVSDDLFNRCLFIGKDSVQRKLLNTAELSKEQLQALTENGANRAIRNLARQKLRRSS